VVELVAETNTTGREEVAVVRGSLLDLERQLVLAEEEWSRKSESLEEHLSETVKVSFLYFYFIFIFFTIYSLGLIKENVCLIYCFIFLDCESKFSIFYFYLFFFYYL
jgi:hypothetical protein